MTEFLHNHKAHSERLAETGRPEVLNVNGTARLVVQDAEAYDRLLGLAERELLRRNIREGLEQARRGELIDGVEVVRELRDIASGSDESEGE